MGWEQVNEIGSFFRLTFKEWILSVEEGEPFNPFGVVRDHLDTTKMHITFLSFFNAPEAFQGHPVPNPVLQTALNLEI